jgi:hypothetical protein
MTDPGQSSAPHAESDDTDVHGGSVPNPDTGAGIGAGSEPTTFEPEEDPDAVEDPS